MQERTKEMQAADQAISEALKAQRAAEIAVGRIAMAFVAGRTTAVDIMHASIKLRDAMRRTDKAWAEAERLGVTW